MKMREKSDKRVRFEDEISVTGVIRKKSRLTEVEKSKKSKNFENFENPVDKNCAENPLLRSCYSYPEREKRVCPEFDPDLDFSINWAKRFLKNISM